MWCMTISILISPISCSTNLKRNVCLLSGPKYIQNISHFVSLTILPSFPGAKNMAAIMFAILHSQILSDQDETWVGGTILNIDELQSTVVMMMHDVF